MKILITGGTGFIGREIVKKISQRNMEAIVLVRKEEVIREELYNLRGILFEPYDYALGSEIPEHIMAEVDGIINMAGEPIFSTRWTREKKKKILSSRIAITRQIVNGLEKIKDRKKPVLVNASAVGYYGDDFLGKVCKRWEAEALRGEEFGARVVLLRTGIVLGKHGGALEKMILPYSFGLGGALGDGGQYFSWVHLEDISEAYLFALENSELRGSINVTAPNPITMNEFSRVLGKVLDKPSAFRTPSFALDLLMGEVAKTITAGQRVYPFELTEKGFIFKYPFVYQALESILR